MRVLVTGGAGFIGTNLVERLHRESTVDEVVVFDNFATGVKRDTVYSQARVIEADLRDAVAVHDAAHGVDAIIHLGALGSVPRSLDDPITSNDVNVSGTLNVLQAARAQGEGHVISASSSSVYGANPIIPKVETMATLPMSPYAVSKLATESYTLAFGSSFGLDTLAFRFFNVFGPYQRADHAYAAVIPRFLDALRRGEPLTVYGDGTQSRDFTSVHAVTDALAKAVTRRVAHPTPVNLAFGRRVSLNNLIAMIQELHGSPIAVEYAPKRVGDVPHSQASPELLLELLPDVEYPSIEDAVRDTYRWYMQDEPR